MSTTHITHPIALHTVSATPNGPTAAPTNPPLPPHTPSNNSRAISQYIYHIASRTLGGFLWCGRRLLDIPRLLARSIWTVLKSFNKSTVILSIIIATVFGAVTWLALKIQAWTGRKDYLEYCRDNVSTLVGDALKDCQAAMKIGLPKPPLSNFKRAATMMTSVKWELRATTLLGRRQTLNHSELQGSMSTRDIPQDYTPAMVIESTFAIFALCFILSMATITVGRIAWRKLDLDARAATSFSFMKRFCRSWQNAIMLVVSLTSILLTAAGTIVSVQSVRISQKSAELAFVQYCTTLKEDERTVECVDALASNHGSSRKDIASHAVDIFALISTILGLSSLAVAAFQMFRQRRIFGRYNKEQV